MNRYKQCRQALGMSQKFVALSVGVSPPMVSQWESGIKEPSKDTLVKLANLFNVTTDYLLFHDETTQKNQPTVSDDERRCQMPENRLKELREKFGLSQIELGNRLGVTQQSVFAWEHGKTSPQIQTAITLAQMYGVSLDYLLGLSDDPKIEKERGAAMNRYKEARRRAGLSQKAAAISLGVRPPSMSDWESGKTKPTHEHLVAMATIYGTTIDYLLGSGNAKEKQSTVSDDGLKDAIISQIQALPDPALTRVADFLSGLKAGQEVSEAVEVAPDPDAGPAL